MAKINIKRVSKTIGKVLLWIFLSIVAIMLLIMIGIQVPYVQKKIVNFAISKVKEKVDTEITLGSFDLILPNFVRLKKLYVEEPSGDTLIYAGEITVRIGLPELIAGNISISKLSLDKTVAKISREKGDSLFNFNFFIEAFSDSTKQNDNKKKKISETEDVSSQLAVHKDSVAGGQTAQEESSKDSSQNSFSIGKIELSDIRFLYDDGYTGNYVKAEIGDFFVSFREFNLQKNIIDINRTGLSNSKAIVKLSPSQDTTTSTNSLSISLRRTSRLRNVTISLDMPGTNLQVNHANLRINPDDVNLGDKKIALKRVLISESEIIYTKTSTGKDYVPHDSINRFDSLGSVYYSSIPLNSNFDKPGKSSNSSSPQANSFDWNISLSSLRFRDNHIVYSDRSAIGANANSNSIFTNPDLSGLSAFISNIKIADRKYQANIEELAFREKRGLILKDLTARVNVTDNEARLEDFKLQTNKSIVYNTTVANYNSFQNIGNDLGNIEFTTKIKKSKISSADIRYFAPEIASQIGSVAGEKDLLYFSGSVTGRVKDLKIESLDVNNDQNFFLALNGQVRGLPEAKTAYYKIDLDSLSLIKDHIEAFLPDSAIPQTISIPQAISLRGNFIGSINDFGTKFKLKTSQGNIESDIQLASLLLEEPKTFRGYIMIDDYNLGELLQNEDGFGELKLKASFGGSASNKKDLMASVGVLVEKFEANQYVYHNIALGGTFSEEHFYGNVSVKDTNLVAEFNGEAAFGDSVPRYDFTLTVEGADLQALNLSEDDLRLGGTLVSNFQGNSIEDINGYVKAKNFLFLKDNTSYRLDSLVAEATNEPEKTMLEVKSPFLNARYEGSVPFNGISPLLKDYFNNYFSLYQDSTSYASSTEEFTLDAEITESELLTEIFIPELVSFMPATVKAEYKGNKASFDLKALLPRVNYQGRILDTLQVNLNSNKGSFVYDAGFRHIKSDPFEIGETSISGKADADAILWNFINKDMDKKETVKYSIGGNVEASDGYYYVKLQKDSLLINGTNFSVPENNQVRIGKTKPVFQDFVLSSADQKLEISSDTSNQEGGKLSFDFSKFRVSNFTALVEAGQNIFSGLIDGNLVLASSEESGSFSSDLKILDLRLFDEDVFNEVSIKADNRTKDQVNLEASLSGKESNVDLSGKLNTSGDTTGIKANLDINMLDLSAIQPFFPEAINELNGKLTGRLDISNNVSNPLINGKLNFNSVNVNPSFLNTTMTLKDETIDFNERTLNFSNFRIMDPNGSVATLKGTVDAGKLSNPMLDLRFSADEFQLMNSKEGKDNMFYGQVVADLDVGLKGSAGKPDIDLNVSLGEKTNFFFLVSQAGSASIEREGIVEFVDMDSTGAFNILNRKDTINNNAIASFGNLNINANIDFTDAAQINIVVDPTTDEMLEIRGNANLSFAMNAGGQSTLAGNYSITEGSYTLKLYGVIKRKFEINKGSSLMWTGDVTNPRLDLATYYRVKTSPEPILVSQTSSNSGNNQSFDNMNFDVYMYIKGNLMEPELNFGIKIPEGERNALVETALSRINQNETEVNKQVFSLLLLNSFMQETATADNSLAYTISSTARKGIGNLLSQQINRFSEQYIKGFKVNVDIESYAGGGAQGEQGRTNVQANVSKQLFNERLTVKVGGSANIEDPNQANNNTANMSTIAGDVEIEYKLTENGVYILQGFRKTEYEDVLDGELRKTGVALIFNKDFYHFRNLFGKKNKNDKDIHSE